MREILIIVLNWNGWVDTKECLDSLRELKNVRFSVLIVDNGSDLDLPLIEDYALNRFENYQIFSREEIESSEKIRPPAPKTLTLIKNGENLGFAKANNIGIAFAGRCGYEYIYMLNNDTVVEPESLFRLFSVLESSNYAAVAPQIRYYTPNDLVWCCGGDLDNYYESYNYKDQPVASVPRQGVIPITFATGCALLFRRGKVGMLSEKFFFGEEDFELSLRLKKRGLKMACVPDAIVYHKESAAIDRSAKYLNKIYVHKLNRMIDIKSYEPIGWPLMVIYRSFKFWLLMLIVYKVPVFKSARFAWRLFRQACGLNEVNKSLFFEILAMDLS